MQAAQQVGIKYMPLRRLAGIGLLIDRYLAHQPHQSAQTLRANEMTLVPQVPYPLVQAMERHLRGLLINQAHQVDVIIALACQRF